MEILAAAPWTYWIAPVIALVTVLAVIQVLVRYLVKVVAPKHPKQ